MNNIAIIILTKNNVDVFKQCVDSISKHNTHDNVSLYVGDTGSDESQFKRLKKYLKTVPFTKQLIRFDYYNFARNHNWIIENVLDLEEDYILFCNDDIELRGDSIVEMLKHAADDVATIGCKLLFPNNTIQHAGHLHVPPPDTHNSPEYYNITHRLLNQPDREIETQHVEGNTFAFCLVKRDTFNDLHMFDEYYEHCFEDADFCIRATQSGLKHVCVGEACCTHHESLSRKRNAVYISVADMNKIRRQLFDLHNETRSSL